MTREDLWAAPIVLALLTLAGDIASLVWALPHGAPLWVSALACAVVLGCGASALAIWRIRDGV